jgi:hypothetical protein
MGAGTVARHMIHQYTERLVGVIASQWLVPGGDKFPRKIYRQRLM